MDSTRFPPDRDAAGGEVGQVRRGRPHSTQTHGIGVPDLRQALDLALAVETLRQSDRANLSPDRRSGQTPPARTAALPTRIVESKLKPMYVRGNT
jgi:hypothetical protein